MSLKIKHDGRLKFRSQPQPSLENRETLWAKGSTRPTLRGEDAPPKKYRRRASF